MNVLNKFTVQSLKLNKKRTIVTIIGIILSSALICGLIGLVSSTQQSLINMVTQSVGNYHTRFNDISEDELDELNKNNEVERYFKTATVGVSILKGSLNEDKPYVLVSEYDDNAFLNNGIKLIEGRLPENENELLISETIITNARIRYELGNTITLNLGKRVSDDGNPLTQSNPFNKLNENIKGSFDEKIIDTEEKTYTIVGIMERPDYSIEQYNAPAYTAITYMNEVPDTLDVSVLYKNPKNYIENNEKLFKEKHDTILNKELLRYQGAVSNSVLKVLYGIATVVMIIIVTSSVFVIRNSFSISVSEKNKQYGMLASMGATKKQIRKTVLFEGFVIGIIGIPLGILFGMLAVIILLKVVNYLLGEALAGMLFIYSLPIVPVLISAAIAAITIYLSCLIPAHRASKISPIEAIRGNNDIKIKSKKLKVSKATKKFFGIGGVIASKNLKRSRKKYVTTVISIVISVVIFISLSSFLHYGNKVSGVYYIEMPYNTVIYNYNLESKDRIEMYDKILKNNADEIDEYAYYKEGALKISKEYFSEFGEKEYKETTLHSGHEYDPTINVIGYNDEYFYKYARSLGVSEKDLDNCGILADKLVVQEENKKEVKRLYTIKNGESVKLGENMVNIAKYTDKNPMGLEGTYMSNGMLIVSDTYFSKLKLEDSYRVGNLFIKADNATTFENKIIDIRKNEDYYKDLKIENLEKFAEMQNKMVLVISIFLYGFITVITLIGVTNIFNTITTNMILRSKEFAMLKSIGMTQKEFSRMIRLESILYGLKSLSIGIPIGILGSYMMYKSYAEAVDCGYELPWGAVIISIIFVFIIVGTTMRYSLRKINKQNIIETIRNDNI